MLTYSRKRDRLLSSSGGDTTNSRIKEVRKAKGLSQAAFGAPFGANRDMINNVENGRAAVSDIMIASICRTYGVNERWLRTGEGEMFVQISRDEEVMAFVGDVMRGEEDNFRRRFLLALSRMPEERWADIEAFARQITAENKEAGQD